MSDYPFLVLSLLFLIPGVLFYALRPDIRRLLRLTLLASLPFATTEFLFYPTYWEPRTLFDLVPRIGFGIEDGICQDRFRQFLSRFGHAA